MKNYEKLKTNPALLFATLLFVISIAEILVMHILPIILPADAPLHVKNITDGIVLAILIAPVLWILVVNPLRGDLHQAQRRAQIILNSAYRGILPIDKDGFIISANPAAQRMFCLSSEKFVGKNYRDLNLPFSQLALKDNLNEKFSYTPANETERFLHLKSVKAVFDNEAFHIFFIEDITEKKSLETDLEVQRAKAVASARLAVLGEMAGGVAHEINTPLASLKLLIYLLEKDMPEDPDSRINTITKKMDKLIDRIAGIVRGLRSFTRDGSRDPMEVISLKYIIEDAVSMTREKYYNHSINLRFEEINDDIEINCRSVEIGQVFLNFLSNAFDAIKDLPERWVDLKVAAKNDTVEIVITDSGFGIPETIAEKIFNPFFTTKEVGKGTGLGLSISTGIIQNHGGTIRLNRECPNTQFIITFPAA